MTAEAVPWPTSTPSIASPTPLAKTRAVAAVTTNSSGTTNQVETAPVRPSTSRVSAADPATRRMWIRSPDQRIWTATGTYGVNASAVAIVAHYFGREVGTIVSMMFDTLAGIGEAVFDTVGSYR